MLESNRRHLELRSDSRCVDGTLGKEPGNPAALGHRPDLERATPLWTQCFPNVNSHSGAACLLLHCELLPGPHSRPCGPARGHVRQAHGRDECVQAGEAKSPLFLWFL